MLRIASIYIFMCLLCSCSLFHVDPMDPQAVNEDVEVIGDDFKRIMFYKGPVVSNIIDDESGNPEVEELYLRSQLEHSRNMRFFLVVHDYYEGDWRGFDQAYDSDGNKFHALSVRHKVKCKLICGYEEVLEVELDKTYLNKHLKEGLYFRLYGPAGTSSSSFHLPGPYIQGFLKGAYVP